MESFQDTKDRRKGSKPQYKAKQQHGEEKKAQYQVKNSKPRAAYIPSQEAGFTGKQEEWFDGKYIVC